MTGQKSDVEEGIGGKEEERRDGEQVSCQRSQNADTADNNTVLMNPRA